MTKPDPSLLQDVVAAKVLDAMKVASAALRAAGIPRIAAGMHLLFGRTRPWRPMPSPVIHRALCPALAAAVIVAAGWRPVVLRAETGPINVEQSTLTVFVYKSGLFSAFADNHIIKAPIARGSISEVAPLSVEVTVHSADLRALDPNLAPDRRADVQARMISAEVLDVAKFPDITFTSTAIEPAGTDRWTVTGKLTIHGQTRSIAFPVARVNGRYRGEVAIKQRDFGIEPIRIAGGAVKVKDEMKVQFEIAR